MMKIGIAQYNPIIGDLKGNVAKIVNFIEKSKDSGCDLVVFPELSLTGYPPRDLLLRVDFIKACNGALDEILPFTKGIGVIIGTIRDGDNGQSLYNSALLLEDGNILGGVDKSLLPNYDVFDEARYFKPSKEIKCLTFRGMKLGISICEDIWNDSQLFPNSPYFRSILDELYDHKPDIFINLSASPYYYGKHEIRTNMISHYAQKYGLPFIYANQIGGNDELLFDGSSMVCDSKGKLILKGKSFKEDLLIYDMEKTYSEILDWKEDISWLYEGLVLGLRDYFQKTGFKKTLLGLSGGIDSTLVTCIAAEALGRENVLGVFMPSRYTSKASEEDALVLVNNLGIEYRDIPLEDIFQEYLKTFNFDSEPEGDLAEENIQARIRGSMLMFISNREGRLLVCPSNKSEIAVGYSTLYGDSCGAIAPIGDIFKSQVFDLCRYINREEEIIPNNIIIKPPTAELRPDQKDEDSLPPYPILDGILNMYIEEEASLQDMIDRGYDRDTIYRIINMVDRSEHKRRQTPPVIKLSDKAFGMGRKYPVVQGFRIDIDRS